MLNKIISGGQTGVDRGALYAALDAGFPCGGWCPEGRKAANGRISDRYPVVELAGAGYRQRTRQNVMDSDGTLVIAFGQLIGGTLETIRFAKRFNKPVLVIDTSQDEPGAAAHLAAEFVESHAITVLNVAGPRESGWKGAREYATLAIATLIKCLDD